MRFPGGQEAAGRIARAIIIDPEILLWMSQQGHWIPSHRLLFGCF